MFEIKVIWYRETYNGDLNLILRFKVIWRLTIAKIFTCVNNGIMWCIYFDYLSISLSVDWSIQKEQSSKSEWLLTMLHGHLVTPVEDKELYVSAQQVGPWSNWPWSNLTSRESDQWPTLQFVHTFDGPPWWPLNR